MKEHPGVKQRTQVAQYFDRISVDYRLRYAEQNPFHDFFFRQRLNAATQGFAFDDKSVLDIGAGTGALYEDLAGRNPGLDYFGCDISAQMLEQSNIPPDRRLVGRAHEIALPRERFDFIFSLGVTTYLEPAELMETWRFIGDRLAPGGSAIISFTNRGSLDHLLRSAMRVAKPLARRGVLGQSFATYAYRSEEVEHMAQAAGLRVKRMVYLNQAFSPFNTILPKQSVALAKLIARQARGAVLAGLSADFLVVTER